MRTLTTMILLVLPAIATAEEPSRGFIQGLAGYSSPVYGDQYMNGVGDGTPRVGLRGGFTPRPFGRVWLGVEAGIDWRTLQLEWDDETANQFRAMVGPRIAFVGNRHAVFFRAAVGYDYLDLLGDTNDKGFAFEPGFGVTYRYEKLIFGGELAVPILWHREKTGDDYMDGFAGVDLQLMFSVGSELF